MKYELREYQTRGMEMLRQSLRSGNKKVILHLATGAGKGLVMSEIVNNVLLNNKKILVVMRRREIIFQTCQNFLKYHNIKASPIMSNAKGYDPKSSVQVCSIDTLRARMEKSDYEYLKDFNVCLVDEAHDCNSPTYQSMFSWLGDKTYLGCTATPYSMGGKPLKFWQSSVCPIQPSELRDNGFLVKARVFAPADIDTKNIRKQAGDFDLKELFRRASESKIVGDIVENYIKYGENKPAILFAVNKAHSSLMAHAFRERGITAIHQDESHSSKERQDAISALKDGRVKVLCNVNIFSTGVDITCATVAILARPTMSTVLYIQQVGRVLRPHPGKDYAIVIDHGGNTRRHDHVFAEREAELEANIGNKKKKNTEPTFSTTDCPKCFAVLPGKPTECIECGHVFEKSEREIKQEDGELKEIDFTSEEFKNSVLAVKINKRYKQLQIISTVNGWKPSAIYFRLYGEFGDATSAIKGFPSWVSRIYKEQNDKPRP